MNSNHVRYASFILLIVTGILAVGDLTKVFPFLPAAYAPLLGIFIIAVKEFLLAQVTPTTNAQTPDNLPPKIPTSLLVIGLCVLSLGMTACQTTTGVSLTTQIKAQLTPNVLAKATQDTVGAVGAAVLANNPKYTADFLAAADALQAIAQQNPVLLTTADFAAVITATKLSAQDQKALSAGITLALGTYQSDFSINFPKLQINYVLFLDATSNGLYIASGNGTKCVPLPVIPVPAFAAPATP